MKIKTILALDDLNKTNNFFYKRKFYRFVFCCSCFWIATLIKETMEIVKCPICNSQKLFINQIFKAE